MTVCYVTYINVCYLFEEGIRRFDLGVLDSFSSGKKHDRNIHASLEAQTNPIARLASDQSLRQ